MFFSDSTDSNLGDSYCGRTLPAVKGQIMANTIDFLQQLLEISCYGDTPHGREKHPCSIRIPEAPKEKSPETGFAVCAPIMSVT